MEDEIALRSQVTDHEDAKDKLIAAKDQELQGERTQLLKRIATQQGEYKQKLAEKEAESQHLQQSLEQQEAERNELQAKITDLQSQIATLHSQIRDLEDTKDNFAVKLKEQEQQSLGQLKGQLLLPAEQGMYICM